MKLNEILRGLKKELKKKKKKVLKRRQTVHLHARATQVGRGLSGCSPTNFHFKFYFSNYIKSRINRFFDIDFVKNINAKNEERRFDRSTVIFKFNEI